MTAMEAGVLAPALPVAWFAVDVAVHVVAARITRLGLLRAEYLAFAVGLTGLAASEALLVPACGSRLDAAALAAADLLIFGGLAYCYFHFVNLALTARRIRLLLDLTAAPEGLTLPEILSRYSARAMVEKRLDRLVGSGQIVERDGRFHLHGRTVLLIVRAVLAMKRLLLGKESEFD